MYQRGKVSAEAFAHGMKDLKDAFPDLPAGWYRIVEKMIDDENWTDEKFKDAVYNLIKTCQYPKPTPGNLLGYDRKIQTMTYEDVLVKTKDLSANLASSFWRSLAIVKIGDQKRYVRKEYEKYFLHNS